MLIHPVCANHPCVEYSATLESPSPSATLVLGEDSTSRGAQFRRRAIPVRLPGFQR